MARKIITFSDENGRRTFIQLGRLNVREFSLVRSRVDRLVSAKMAGEPPDRETAVWLNTVSDYVREKLAQAGLIEARKSYTLGAWIAEYLTKRTDLKESSLHVMRRAQTRIVEFLGESKPLRSITKGNAEDWRRWLQAQGNADNTVRKMCGVAKQFFSAAEDHKLIDENPFDGIPIATIANREKFYFVTPAEAHAVIDACPSVEWRVLFALARWGGLRTRSETHILRWADIDWERDRMTIRSPKTEHHAGKGSRVCPIFPELRPHLVEAFEAAEDGAEFVVSGKKSGRCNLGKAMRQIISNAGVTPWPKLFQNLRSTRETELAERFPIQAVTTWIGNSPEIARQHYLQTTEEHFRRAVLPAQQDQSGAQQKAQRNEPESSGIDVNI
jgi:integrase